MRSCSVTDKTIEIEADATLTDQGEQLEFHYLLRISAERDSASLRQSLKVSEETLNVTGGRFKQTALIENRNGQAKLCHEKRFLGEVSGWDKYVETLAPQEATMLSRLYDLDTNRRANLFKRYLAQISSNYEGAAGRLTGSLEFNEDESLIRFTRVLGR